MSRNDTKEHIAMDDGKLPFEVGCDLAVYNCQPRLDLGLTPREVKKFERRWGDGKAGVFETESGLRVF